MKHSENQQSKHSSKNTEERLEHVGGGAAGWDFELGQTAPGRKIELHMTRDGKKVWIESNQAARIRPTDDATFQITEVLERIAERMGREFGRHLETVGALRELLSHATGKDAPEQGHGKEGIIAAVENWSRWASEIQAFGQGRWVDRTELSLNRIVVDAETRLGPVLGDGVQLSITPDAHADRIEATAGQVGTIINNLVCNACDAMPRGGRIVIGTSNVAAQYLWEGDDSRGERRAYVCLSIADSGVGMASEVVGNLFEPFFTTKATGVGTGLGLASVYSIVRKCRGHIRLITELGKGTTFSILFPSLPAGIEQPQSDVAQPGREYSGNETVLVVDDEEDFRLLAREILEDHGYRVLDAGNGLEALAKAREYQGPIDLLLSDVVMPFMGGRELAERFRWFRPHTKVLFMSGYANEVVGRYGIFTSDRPVIEKPFTSEGLTRAVRRLIDS